MEYVNTILIGPVGCGKSTTIAQLAHRTQTKNHDQPEDKNQHGDQTENKHGDQHKQMNALVINGYLDDVSADGLLSQLGAYCRRGTAVLIDDMDQLGPKSQLIVAHCMDQFTAVRWTFTATIYGHIIEAIQVRCCAIYLDSNQLHKPEQFGELNLLHTVTTLSSSREAIQYGLELLDRGYSIDDLICRLEQEHSQKTKEPEEHQIGTEAGEQHQKTKEQNIEVKGQNIEVKGQNTKTKGVIPILLALSTSRYGLADEIAVAHLMSQLHQLLADSSN
jgi:GTPase SAR1 family protein